MNWLLIAIISHFLYAGVFIIDRYLLKRSFRSPLSYIFYTGILSIFVLFLAPFDFSVPAAGQLIFSLGTGFAWLLATFIFYTALYKGEASRVVPTVGGFIPLFTLILSFVFLNERLSAQELTAFCLLVAGGIFLSLLITKANIFSNGHKIQMTKAFIPALCAALVFAIYFVMTKFVFLNQSFISGMIWIRLGAVFATLCLLIFSPFRKIIFKKVEHSTGKTFGLFVFVKSLSAVAAFLIYWAVFLGSVTIINALQGIQYLFILLLAFILFRKIPSLREQFKSGTLFQKIIAVVLICLGLVILVL